MLNNKYVVLVMCSLLPLSLHPSLSLFPPPSLPFFILPSLDPPPPSYFTVLGSGEDLRWAELESTRGEYVLAHNGWVMNADPLVNFADEGSQVYT